MFGFNFVRTRKRAGRKRERKIDERDENSSRESCVGVKAAEGRCRPLRES